MILTADATKLKCLYFKYVYLAYQADAYATKCKDEEIEKILCTLEGYFNIYLATATENRLCECKFTNLVDTLETLVFCADKEIDEIITA